MIEVLEPGLLTTVQDSGRPGWGHLGVPHGGAADPWSLAVANTLAGNEPDAAALEVTVAGPRLRALREVDVAISGADLDASAGQRPIVPGQAVRLAVGDDLSLPGPPSPGAARAYVAVAGGIDVPVVLGSRSTCLAAGFGGLDGRPVRTGDVLEVGAPAGPVLDGWPGEPIAPRVVDPDGSVVLRILPGPAVEVPLVGPRWTVSAASDRMGLRLAAESDEPLVAAAMSASHGVVRGTIQVPPDGRPIILQADHQPTGGYAVAGVVIAADLATLGQLAPDDRLRFEAVSVPTARAALAEQRAAWRRAVEALRGGARWDDLWQSAGG